MKRAGFTMIELIFVIVILGILSAVALPKMLGVATNSKIATVESFMATMNRTVGPAMWSETAANGGSVKALEITEYVDLPNGITIDLSTCGTDDGNVSTYDGAEVGDVSTAALPVAEKIYCTDGSSVGSPIFSFSSTENNSSVQNN
jgi:prepilin-type N-terminal cleavage/methylation domain-containing protein